MKKKNGFVFIETLIVVAVLTASLLMVYSTYSAIIMKEKTRVKYNDSVYLYRTYYLEKFFTNFRLDILASDYHLDKARNRFITSFNCKNSILLENEEDNEGFCELVYTNLNVSNMYLAFNDLSEFQNCPNGSSACSNLLQVNETMAEYLKTIGGKGTNGYRIILEFSENKDGTRCTGDGCQLYYSTISLGELV